MINIWVVFMIQLLKMTSKTFWMESLKKKKKIRKSKVMFREQSILQGNMRNRRVDKMMMNKRRCRINRKVEGSTSDWE